jgi:hypothetical protein
VIDFMRVARLLFLLVFTSGFLTAITVACQPSTTGEAPRIGLETNLLELGQIPNGEIADVDIIVSNDGDSPLVIESVTTTCGCTTARLNPMTIAPGGTGTLDISFDSGAHGPDLRGEIMRQVIVTSNDLVQPKVVVDLRATIVGPVEP